jgi:DNA-binding response OmpR family regulator
VARRLLVVDDDPKSLFALCAVLEQHGFAVQGASNPAELRHFNANSLDAAIIDLRLPTMPGQMLARQLVHSNPQLKVIYITAYSDDFRGTMDGLHRVPLLVKPLDVNELIRLIQ